MVMGTSKREPTIEELLSDPMMAAVLQRSRITPDEVRALLNDARERMAKAKARGQQAGRERLDRSRGSRLRWT
jgi:hypothetical protein